MAQLALELVADCLIASPLPTIPAESKRFGAMLVKLSLATKTATTALLLGRASVSYARYAEIALRTWRERARMLEDDHAGITALRWRQYYERARAGRDAMREAMTGPQLGLTYAREYLARVPEITALDANFTVLGQIRECVDLCIWRGRTMARYEAAHPEAASEFVELGFDTEAEESSEAEEVDSDEGL